MCTSWVTLCDHGLRQEAAEYTVLHPTVTICMHRNQDRALGLSDFMLEGPSMMSPSLMFVLNMFVVIV